MIARGGRARKRMEQSGKARWTPQEPFIHPSRILLLSAPSTTSFTLSLLLFCYYKLHYYYFCYYYHYYPYYNSYFCHWYWYFYVYCFSCTDARTWYPINKIPTKDFCYLTKSTRFSEIFGRKFQRNHKGGLKSDRNVKVPCYYCNK